MKKAEVDKLYKVPEIKPQTVCICGSTKFKDDMMELARNYTTANRIVVMPNVFAHSEDPQTDEAKELLDGLHLWKIRKSSFVAVVCRDFYVGKSTIREMNYAYDRGLEIFVFNNGDFVFTFSQHSNKNFSLVMLNFSEQSRNIYYDMFVKKETKS